MRVAVLSTGNELCTAAHLAPGRIYDSNLPMVVGLLAAWGADVQTSLVSGDQPTSVRTALQRIAADVDLVISTGGISVGEEDHVRVALREAGGRGELLKLAMRPGRQVVLGGIG